MAVTAPTAEVRSATPGRPEATRVGCPLRAPRPSPPRPPLAALAYGAFAHGAAQIPESLALSAAFPAISDSLAGDALAGVPDRPTAADLRRAAHTAGEASSLNPPSVERPLAQAAIDLRRGHLVTARSGILEAVGRQPDNVQAWRQLVGVELARRDARAAKRAIDRAWRSTRSTTACLRSRAEDVGRVRS